MTADRGGPRGARARAEEAPAPRRNVQMTLPKADDAVRLARHATRSALAGWQLAQLEEAAILLVSELVTNAVRHARDTRAVALRLRATGTWLRIEIHDGDPRWPRPRTPAACDESGFGLVLVDALADKWGVRESGTGKAVWAELDAGTPDSRGVA
jgi:serine/threonine-protein kinase RsbW